MPQRADWMAVGWGALTCLGEPLVDVTDGLVIHLLGAVEHVHHDTQRSAKILGSLCLSGTSGPGRGSGHRQMEGLCQGDVAPGIGHVLVVTCLRSSVSR